MNQRKKIYLLLLCYLILTFSAAGCKADPPSPEPGIDAQQPGLADHEKLSDGPSAALPKELSPFTGLPVNKIFNRPYAIIVENERAARPQAGLQEAELVYEVPVEGGITRFLTFFCSPFEKDIGPVRSARPCFAYLTNEYDGFLAHCGNSIHTEAVFSALKLKHINEISNSLYFKRSKSRNMPHNLYTDLASLTTGAEKFNYLQGNPPQTFFTFIDTEQRKPAQIISPVLLSFSDRNQVEYHWDALSETYTRYNDGSPFIDSNHDKPVEIKNIIVQFVATRVFTEEGHLDITMLGEGKGYLFSNGRIEKITWEKDSYSQRTRFLGADEEEIRLMPGNTWLHLLPQSGKVEWQVKKIKKTARD